MSMLGKTVIITGASSGIGKALAIEAAAQGATIGLTARRLERLEQLAAELRTRGTTVAVEAADVSEREMLQAAIHRLEQRLGPADILIANAGVGLPCTADGEHGPAVETMTRVNFLGVVNAFNAVLKGMLSRGRGQLVAISSLASYKGMPGASGYCASKAAVNTYCESLRIELRSRGIAVTTVCPGFIRTAMTEKNTHPMPLLMDADQAARRILRAVNRRAKVYNFPWLMYRLMRLTYWLPDWLMARVAVRPRFPE